MPAWTSPRSANQSAELCTVKSSTATDGQLVPGERRRHGGAGRWAHRVGGGDRPVAGVLVVVDEAPARRAPPSTSWWSPGPARAARASRAERDRGAAYLGEGPARLDPDVDVDPRPPVVFGQPHQPELVEHRLDQRRRSRPRSSKSVPGCGSRSMRSSSGWSTSSPRVGQGWKRQGAQVAPPRSTLRGSVTGRPRRRARPLGNVTCTVSTTRGASRGPASGRSARPRIARRHSARGTSAGVEQRLHAAPGAQRHVVPDDVALGRAVREVRLVRVADPDGDAPDVDLDRWRGHASTLSRRAGRRTASTLP